MTIYTCQLPHPSLIEGGLNKIDYTDSFAVTLPAEEAPPLQQLPVLFFHAFPRWFGWLIGLRELIAGWIGLKTAKGIDIQAEIDQFQGREGEAIALFKVMRTNEQEIMMGENDQHLDFRLSFFRIEKEGAVEIVLSTTVEMNNWLGRVYFIPVKPIHRLIVPIIIKRMIRQYQKT